MSKYTTEVRYICETLAGLENSAGFDSVDDIITKSAPLVFSMAFPIFDEDYRLPLEKKILLHYYVHEIAQETVGLWKLRINTRMGEIMPYYNQLYKSAALEFNPFFDVDLSRKHNKNFNLNSGEVNSGTTTGAGETTSSGAGSRTDTIDTTENLTGNETNTVTGNTTTDTTGKVISSGEDDRTITDKVTGKTDGTENSKFNSTDTVNRDDDSTTTGKNTLVSDVANHQVSKDVGSENENTNESLIKYIDSSNAFSDTPQGSIKDVESQAYLTDARIIHEDDRSTNTREIDKTHDNTITTDGTVDKSETTDTTQTIKATSNTSDVYNGTSELTKTNTTSNDATTVNKGSTNGTTDTTEHGAGAKTENAEKLNTSELTGNEKLVGNSTTDDKTNTSNTSASNTQKDITVKNMEDYIESIEGKQGSDSYSKLLTQFRETFLNIDMMVIEELNTMFFGLY